MSGAGFQSAVRPVEKESKNASETAIIPHHQMGERNAEGSILSLKTVTQILVSLESNKSLVYIILFLGKVNGRWSKWNAWSSCTKPCEGGTQRRERTCTRPSPEHGGKKCRGEDSKMRDCNTEPCVAGTVIGIIRNTQTK